MDIDSLIGGVIMTSCLYYIIALLLWKVFTHAKK